jgi:hypothetical protein
MKMGAMRVKLELGIIDEKNIVFALTISSPMRADIPKYVRGINSANPSPTIIATLKRVSL